MVHIPLKFTWSASAQEASGFLAPSLQKNFGTGFSKGTISPSHQGYCQDRKAPTRALWRGGNCMWTQGGSWGNYSLPLFLGSPFHLRQAPGSSYSLWLWVPTGPRVNDRVRTACLCFFGVLEPLLTSLLSLPLCLLRWTCKQTVDFPQISNLYHIALNKTDLFSGWFFKKRHTKS